MKRYIWKEKQLTDGGLEIVMGNIRFVVRGLESFPPAERAAQIELMIEHQMREVAPGARKTMSVTAIRGTATQPVTPPLIAEAILQWFSPKASCEATLGDLQEMLESDSTRLGEAHAKRLYWLRVASSVGPSVWRRFLGLSFVSGCLAYLRSRYGV